MIFFSYTTSQATRQASPIEERLTCHFLTVCRQQRNVTSARFAHEPSAWVSEPDGEVLLKRQPPALISAPECTGNHAAVREAVPREEERGRGHRAAMPVENGSGPGRRAKEAAHSPGKHSALVFHNTRAPEEHKHCKRDGR